MKIFYFVPIFVLCSKFLVKFFLAFLLIQNYKNCIFWWIWIFSYLRIIRFHIFLNFLLDFASYGLIFLVFFWLAIFNEPTYYFFSIPFFSIFKLIHFFIMLSIFILSRIILVFLKMTNFISRIFVVVTLSLKFSSHWSFITWWPILKIPIFLMMFGIMMVMLRFYIPGSLRSRSWSISFSIK